MMQKLSNVHQEELERAQNYFKRGNLHPSYMAWRDRYILNQSMYDGSGQWREEDIVELAKIGQLPLTVNLVKGFINTISGIEMQSRHRTGIRSATLRPEHDKLAAALTTYLFNFQERENTPYKGAKKLRGAMIGGVSWSNIYSEDNKQFYEYVDAINVVPDPDDLSDQFDNMKYICRKRWMWPDTIVKTWPKIRDMINVKEAPLSPGIYTPEIDDRNSNYTSISNYSGYEEGKILVVEVQYKKPKKSYSGIDINGNYFETFNLEQAEEFVDSSKDIEEIDSHRIMRTVFFDNVLLEYAPLNPDLPSLQDFTYIPYVWAREFKTGIPYGIVDDIRHIQIDCNLRLTKSVYLINSSTTTIKGPLPPGMTVEGIRKELKRRDRVLIVPDNTDIQVESNAPLGEEQFKIIEQHLKLMQRVTGVNDEMLGIQTNATSAVSQNVRQMSSMRKNLFAFDNYSYMKIRESKFLLSLIQGGGLENIFVALLTPEYREFLILNLTKEYKGKKYVFNDIRTLPLDLYIEEVPDYKSTFEEQREMLQALLGNANANLIIQSPEMLRLFGFRDADKIAEEMKKIMHERAMLEQGVPPQGMGNPQQMTPMPANANLATQSLVQ